MSFTAPQASELFSDATSAADVAQRFEQYKDALDGAATKTATGEYGFEQGQGIVKRTTGAADVLTTLEKSLTAEQLASVQDALSEAKASLPDVQKDWTLTNPLATGLKPYDLLPAAQMLVPKQTPLRNTIPRTTGQGSAHQFKQITGISNAGVGGVANLSPFFTSDTASTAFGPINLRRPGKISYASQESTVAYKEFGVSDQVNFSAQFAGQGFTNLRQLSHTAALWAHLMGEERAFLAGRGMGAVAAPTYTLAASGSGSTIGAATYYVKVTSSTGLGESLPGAEVSVAATAGQNLVITLTTQPAGAVNYGVYISMATNTETFQGFYSPTSAGVITISAFTATAQTVPTSDTTSSTQAFDGLLTVATDPARSGYVKRLGSTLSTAAPGIEFQNAFQVMYGNNFADPDHIYTTGAVRVELSEAIKNNGSGNGGGYRLTITQDQLGGVGLGSVVTQITNEVTGKVVDVNVHPFMPAGAALIRSAHLPFADSGVSDTVAFRAVQGADTLVLEWPVIQMTYDISTYSFGALVHYAPQWSGAITGIL